MKNIIKEFDVNFKGFWSLHKKSYALHGSEGGCWKSA